MMQSDRLNHWKDSLQDIIHHVQIESETCVSHVHYGKVELEPDRLERFQSLPKVLQQRYLNLQVRNFIHGIYFTGTIQPETAVTSEPTGATNNMAWGLNLDFYTQIHESNCGQGFFDRGWCIIGQVDGLVAVKKQNLTLYVEPDRHLQTEVTKAGDIVAVKMPCNRLKTGYYLAIGNAGLHDESQQINLYFNLCAEGAVPVMGFLTQRLNSLEIPFTFQVPSNPEDYDRYESGILYCARSDYGKVRSVLADLYREHGGYFRAATPLLTRAVLDRAIAPGLAMAEEPSHKFSESEDYGLHCCQILTHGLLQAYEQGEDDPGIKELMILRHLDASEIDPEFADLEKESLQGTTLTHQPAPS
jgi:hypothetical protein